MTIWKFPLQITDRQWVSVPGGSKILSADNQHGVLCLWAMVNPESNTRVQRKIAIIGTGNPMPQDEAMEFIGTVILGVFVWHVFEVLE